MRAREMLQNSVNTSAGRFAQVESEGHWSSFVSIVDADVLKAGLRECPASACDRCADAYRQSVKCHLRGFVSEILTIV